MSGHDMDRKILPREPEIGEPVSADLVQAVATLLYFVAGICDVSPHELCLGHLVGALRDRHDVRPTPRRRWTD